MSKRKRGESDSPESGRGPLHPPLEHQISSLRGTVDRAKRNLVSALKLARGFERQKLGRRQKQAAEEPQTLLRLREEVVVLKQLDLEKTAGNYLVKHLAKAKRVRESPAFRHAYGSDPQVDTVKPGAEANVVARLFNSAPVKEAMNQIMETVYQVLGLKVGDYQSLRALSHAEQGNRTNERELEGDVPDTSWFRPESANDLEKGPQLLSDVESALLELSQDRLADSEDDNSQRPSLRSDDISRSPSPPQSHSKSNTMSSFLPSLSMGGYYSGSEHDEDDSSAAKPRKNRRGQRARQQLAELKYGKNARHLQNQKLEGSRNAGWDAKRGAVDPSNRRRGGQTYKQSSGNSASKHSKAGATRRERPEYDQKPRDDTGTLHPSWEAAKQRKSQSVDQATFTGTKITFE